MDFDAAIQLNDLGLMVENQYGKWGHFTKESADAIVETVTLETEIFVPDKFKTKMAQLAVTWMNESTFAVKPKPNENKAQWNPWNFDIGPLQLNLQWTMRMAWQGEIQVKDILWRDVFGTSFYEQDGVTPCAFNGNLIQHLRTGMRRLLVPRSQELASKFHDQETMEVVLYTGAGAQPHRARDWQKFRSPFETFFEAYTS